MLIANRYEIIEMIGKGNFGVVMKGKNIRTNELVAIKIESIEGNKKILKHEAKLYQYLAGNEGFITIKWFTVDNINSYLVMDLLGSSLSKYKNVFNEKDIYLIGVQMIKRIKLLHKKGFIHRDIKPDNFLFGLKEKKDILYLIDLGFCKSYLYKNNKHISNKYCSHITGTPIFVSLNIHNKNECSRRDDIESILYIILFLMDKLEWNNLMEYNDIILDQIKNMKEEIIMKKAISNNIIELFVYCRNLKFEECPNYDFIMNKLIFA